MWTWDYWQTNRASGKGETWIQDIQMAKSVFWALSHTASCVVIDVFPLVALLDYLGRISPLSHQVICKLLPAMTCLASIFPCNQDCVPVLYSKIDHLGFRLTTIKLKLFYKVVYCLSLGSTWCHKHATVEAHVVRYSFPTHYRTRAS